jgi:ribosome biogenesis GTPase
LVSKKPAAPAKHPTLLDGQVVAAFGRSYEVEFADGRILRCVTRGKKGGVACGDRVAVKPTGADQGAIESILPRTSLLYRSDTFRTKTLAANVTQILIVIAAVPSFYEELLNRALVAAEAAQIRAVIVLNKSDLERETRPVLEALQLYRDIGYDVVSLSARNDLSPLQPFLKGQTSILVGQSGMGKSSIINKLIPEVQAETAEISEALDSGKHTTTHARLYHLDATSHIIDSPGLQEFGLHHLTPEQIDHAFREFRPYLGQCRFNDCKHISEPDCAVLRAVAQGHISERRLRAYQKILQGTHSL